MKVEDVKIGMKVVFKGSGAGWCTAVRKCVGKTFTIESRAHEDSNEFCFKEVQWYFDCADFEPVSEQSDSSVRRFHVGQPVRCIKDYSDYIRKGKIYTITKVDKTYVYVLKDDGFEDGFHPRNFEPAYALEVGCKVRVVDCNFSPTHNGREGYVTVYPNLYGKAEFRDDNTYQFDKEHLIVLEPAPKKSDVDLVTELLRKDLIGNEIDYRIGIDFASGPVYGAIHAGKWDRFIMKHGGNNMENNEKKYKELAERMKDEYVGFDTTKTLAKQNGTVFLKKAGECAIERRDVTMTLTVDDIETLLKQKGITKALGVHEIEAYSGTYTVGIIKFVPIKKDKFTEANEAV